MVQCLFFFGLQLESDCGGENSGTEQEGRAN
jgi:hypothetical protein